MKYIACVDETTGEIRQWDVQATTAHEMANLLRRMARLIDRNFTGPVELIAGEIPMYEV